MPSAYEGFPNTILEAHSYGCPVLAFKSYAALDWIVNNGGDALLAPPFDVDELSNYAVQLAKNPGKLEEMQLSALKNAHRFTIDKVGEQWLSFFQSFDHEVC